MTKKTDLRYIHRYVGNDVSIVINHEYNTVVFCYLHTSKHLNMIDNLYIDAKNAIGIKSQKVFGQVRVLKQQVGDKTQGIN